MRQRENCASKKKRLMTLSVLKFCRSCCCTGKAICEDGGALTCIKMDLIRHCLFWSAGTTKLINIWRYLSPLTEQVTCSVKVYDFIGKKTMIIFDVKSCHTILLNKFFQCILWFVILVWYFWYLHFHSGKNRPRPRFPWPSPIQLHFGKKSQGKRK